MGRHAAARPRPRTGEGGERDRGRAYARPFSAAIHPPLLRPDEMAELLAAIVAQQEDVAVLVGALAPRNARAILDELERLGDGRLAHDGISHALRWILPELHEQLAGEFRAALA